MPTYQRRGEVPRKRHIQFRDNGTLLTEEVMGLEGFSGNESILYHLISPCRVKKLGDFDPIAREEWVPDAHAHRHLKTMGIEAEGDAVSGRQLLMWNSDVEISLCRPAEAMESFYRNGEGDEIIFVHEGSGTIESIFGDLPYRDGDYIVIPRGTTYRVVPEGPQRYLVFESPWLMEIPKRYRNEYGQLLEHAPYYHRDIHPPTELRTHSSAGTATSIRGRSTSTTSSRSRAASTCRRPRTRPSRGGTSSSARSARGSSTLTRWRCRFPTTTRI